MPGSADTVYMDWTAQVIDSPLREGNDIPKEIRPIWQQALEFVEDNYIEFYEMFDPRS